MSNGSSGGAVADRGDDLDVGPHAEQELERLAEDVVVLDEEDADRAPHGAEPYSADRKSA